MLQRASSTTYARSWPGLQAQLPNSSSPKGAGLLLPPCMSSAEEGLGSRTGLLSPKQAWHSQEGYKEDLVPTRSTGSRRAALPHVYLNLHFSSGLCPCRPTGLPQLLKPNKFCSLLWPEFHTTSTTLFEGVRARAQKLLASEPAVEIY